MKTFNSYLTESSGFDKDVHVSYYEKYPEYKNGNKKGYKIIYKYSNYEYSSDDGI